MQTILSTHNNPLPSVLTTSSLHIGQILLLKSRRVDDLNISASILIASFSASQIASIIDSLMSVCVLMLCVVICCVVMLVEAMVSLLDWFCSLNAWRSRMYLCHGFIGGVGAILWVLDWAIVVMLVGICSICSLLVELIFVSVVLGDGVLVEVGLCMVCL